MPDRLRRVIKVENFGFTSHVQDCWQTAQR